MAGQAKYQSTLTGRTVALYKLFTLPPHGDDKFIFLSSVRALYINIKETKSCMTVPHS